MRPENLSDPREVEMASLRGEFRIAQVALGQAIKPDDIIGYEDCEKAYNELQTSHSTVQNNLFKVVMKLSDADLAETRQMTRRFVSWFAERRPSGNRSTPETYEVSVNIKNGQLDNHSNQSMLSRHTWAPIAVTMHATHRSGPTPTGKETAALTGPMRGLVIFGADAIRSVFKLDDVTLGSHAELDTRVRNSLETQSRREALAHWAQPLTEVADKGKDHEGLVFGLGYTPLRKLLTLKLKDQETALNTLDDVFAPKYFNSIYTMLSQPIREIDETLQKHPYMERRYHWFLHNAVEMRREIEAIRQKRLVYGYKDVFMAQLEAKERPKTNQIAALAAALGQRININNCLPRVIREKRS